MTDRDATPEADAGPEVAIGAGGPERLFGVTGLGRHDAGFSGRQRTGAWNRSRGGSPTVGSLGVLVDDVLALSVTDRSPSGATVSTGITIELAGPVPTDGRELTCVGGPVAVHERGALIRGTVHDDTGALVAVATQRQRFVPAAAHHAPVVPGGDAATLLHGLAGAVEDRSFVVPGSPLLANPVGHVHGGMSLYLSTLLAEEVLLADGATLPLGAVSIAHLRPMPVDVPVRYTAEVLHTGRTLRLARVWAAAADGRLLTTATVTLQ